MRKIGRAMIVAGVVFGAFGVAAAAEKGYYLEELQTRQSARGTERTVTLRSWVAGGKLRKEDNDRSTTIVRGDRGLLWVTNPRDRTYFEVDAATMSATNQANLRAILAPGEDPAKWLVATGKTKQIGAWNAYEVRVDDRPMVGVSLSIWLSRDVPIAADVRDAIVGTVFEAAGGVGQLLAGLRELQGYPVAIEMTMRLGGQSIGMRQRLTRVESVEIDSSRFDIPTGYTRTASPFDTAPEDNRMTDDASGKLPTP